MSTPPAVAGGLEFRLQVRFVGHPADCGSRTQCATLRHPYASRPPRESGEPGDAPSAWVRPPTLPDSGSSLRCARNHDKKPPHPQHHPSTSFENLPIHRLEAGFTDPRGLLSLSKSAGYGQPLMTISPAGVRHPKQALSRTSPHAHECSTGNPALRHSGSPSSRRRASMPALRSRATASYDNTHQGPRQ